jgi:hypothetical protein
MEASMKVNIGAVLAVAVLAGLGLGATADMPGPLPTPSASLGIELDVKPNEGTPGQFVVSSVVTDLESGDGHREATPRSSRRTSPPGIETGSAGKWALQISVMA